MGPRFSSIVVFLFGAACIAAEPKITFRGALDRGALSGLVEVWELDSLQREAGLPGNLRLSTLQDYLVDESQLKELPEPLVQTLTTSPFLPEGPMADSSWSTIVARWRTLSVEERLPYLKVVEFDPEDQADALLWYLRQHYSLPSIRRSAPKRLKQLAERLVFKPEGALLAFEVKDPSSKIEDLRETVALLRDITQSEIDLTWSVELPGGPWMEAAERYRLKLRLETGDPAVAIREGRLELTDGDGTELKGWLELAQSSESEVVAKANEALKSTLSVETQERWTLFADNRETDFADLDRWLKEMAPWPERVPETKPLVHAVAKHAQNRVRPWKILQMGEGTDVAALLSLIRTSSSILPTAERKITLAHGAFPLSIEYQMRPGPEALADALLILSTENAQARKVVITRLEEGDDTEAGLLLARLSTETLRFPEIALAAAEARERLGWHPPARETAAETPAPEPKSELKPEPNPPTACSVGMSTLFPVAP